MLRFENVATPLAAGTLRVPERVPPPGFVPIAIVTAPAKPVAVLPCASCAVTVTAGMIAPAAVLAGWEVNTSWVAGPGVMLNATLVSETRPEEVARSVYPFAALLMLRLLNVATPAEALRLLVPERLAPVGLDCSATATVFVAVPTRLPNASRISTCTAGEIEAPAVVVDGSTKKCNRLATAGAISKSTERADVSAGKEVACRVYPVPALSMLKDENVATPFTADAVAVPDRVPPFGLSKMATVMLRVSVVTRLPCASWTSTCTAGEIGEPAVSFEGCTKNARWSAVPPVISNVRDVALVRPP